MWHFGHLVTFLVVDVPTSPLLSSSTRFLAVFSFPYFMTLPPILSFDFFFIQGTILAARSFFILDDEELREDNEVIVISIELPAHNLGTRILGN